MCFNTVIVNPRRRDIRVPVFNLLTFARYNRDGFSIYVADDKEEKVYRTLEFDKFVEFTKENVKHNKLVHIHFRAASSGSISLRNVHMWKVSSNEESDEYYFISHNGFVHRFSRITYVFPNVHYWSKALSKISESKMIKELSNGIKEELESDTLQFIKTEDFRNALFNDVSQFNKVFEKYDFWGVLFATNPKRVIAVSYGKPLHIVLSNSILYFSNEDITSLVSKKKKIYGFDFIDALHTTCEDAVVVFDLETMSVEKTIKLERKVYYYVSSNKKEKFDKETMKHIDEAHWYYY
jgi:predicted glutamine amidotransferase/YHS domain-containing protein